MRVLFRCSVFLVLVGLVMAGCAAPEKTVQKAPCEKSVEAKAVPSAEAMPQPTEAEKGKAFGVVWRAAKPPVIDGAVNDACWGKKLAGELVDNATGKPVDWKTDVWLAYDKDNLYLAVRLAEPEMDEVICMVTERDGDVWTDDGMEVFLDPTNTKNPDVYYHIMVNAAGTLADRQGAPDSMGLDWVWDAEGSKVGTTRAKDYWTIEMAIPMSDMDVKGDQAGKHWAANFCRTRHGNIMESAWSQTGSYTFHVPEQFGHIAFR